MRSARTSSKVEFVIDERGICVHLIHDKNMSGCFPQYLIPRFLAAQLFPALSTVYLGIESS